MRFLLIGLVLTQIGCTAQSKNSTTESTGAGVTAAIKISWQDTANFNPFSVNDLSYEIWHNDNFLIAHDDTSIILSIENYPQLVSGCIQIKVVAAEQASDLSDKACYGG